MSKYQLSHMATLPPEAENDLVEKVKRACKWDKVSLGGSAQFHLEFWRIGVATLRQAVCEHIEKGRKIFRKYDPKTSGKLLESNLQANVTLFDGKEIYVEMILTAGVRVILNAHEHATSKRLPQ